MSDRPKDRLRIALAQLNPLMGDIAGNLARVRAARAEAARAGADLVLFPELFLCGYPPEDLVMKPALLDDCRAAIESLATETADGGPGVLLGTPWREDGKPYNAVVWIDGGKVQATTRKVDLPNYGVFDEMRVFAAGPMPGPLNIRGVRIGVPICEDIWTPDVVECLAETGAEILLVPNGSPFDAGKRDVRMQPRRRARGRKRFAAGLSQPDLRPGRAGVRRRLLRPQCRSQSGVADARLCRSRSRSPIGSARPMAGVCAPGEKATLEQGHAAVYAAMMLALRDYVNKNRFPGVVIGLSGGIDSALTAAVAVDALGADRVRCMMMPSRYTAQESLERRGRNRATARRPLRHHRHRGGGEVFHRHAGAAVCGRAPSTPPRRTSSRAFAGFFSWRSPTSSATWSSPPATSRR